MSIVFDGKLLEVKLGQVIKISGQILPNANRVNINLRAGHSKHDIIALHLSWRFNENIIVRNTFDAKGWGPEERLQNRNPDFKNNLGVDRDKHFVLLITVKDKYFDISINGYRYCVYHHRHPISTIRMLSIERDVEFLGFSQLNERVESVERDVEYIGFNQLNLAYTFRCDFPSLPNFAPVLIVRATHTVTSDGNLKILFRYQGQKPIEILLPTSEYQNKLCLKDGGNDDAGFLISDKPSSSSERFLLNEQYIIAIGFDRSDIHIAVNGCHYQNIPLNRGDESDPACDLTISGGANLKINVREVKHINMCVNNSNDVSQACIKYSSPHLYEHDDSEQIQKAAVLSIIFYIFNGILKFIRRLFSLN